MRVRVRVIIRLFFSFPPSGERASTVRRHRRPRAWRETSRVRTGFMQIATTTRHAARPVPSSFADRAKLDAIRIGNICRGKKTTRTMFRLSRFARTLTPFVGNHSNTAVIVSSPPSGRLSSPRPPPPHLRRAVNRF